jgi:hypothetical protein
MSDRGAASTLGRLDEAPELHTSIDSLIAAYLRQHPDLSDGDIVRRIRGLDDPARVVRVRGMLAAGHDPDSGPAGSAQEPSQPAPGPGSA